MDWQTVLSSVLGSSLATAGITALLQHSNWVKQKRNEERLTLAKRILELTTRVDELARSGERDVAQYENTLSELSILLTLISAVFESRRAKEHALAYLTVLQEARQEPDTRQHRLAAAWNLLVACLFAEALNVPEKNVPVINVDWAALLNRTDSKEQSGYRNN